MSVVKHDLVGTPVLHLPEPGPRYRAGLVFRVGTADETLPVAGVTHLVEHLALHHREPGDHANGSTGTTHTHFTVSGGADEVVAFVNGVCAALGDLPLQRLEAEKSILLTEAAGRGEGADSLASLYRYGATGHGVAGMPETGVPTLDAATVTAWARRWFTRGNVALWVSGPTLPQGFDLGPLPVGPAMPCPEPISILPGVPCWFGSDGPFVHVSGEVPRSDSALVLAHLLDRSAFRELRQDAGISYHAQATYRRVSASTARIEVVADALPEQLEGLVGGVVDLMAGTLLRPPTEADLGAAKRTVLEPLETLDHERASLPVMAEDLLLGHEPRSPQELAASIREVTADAVHEAAEAFHASALARVPVLGLDWAGWRAVNAQEVPPVEGARVARRDGAPGDVTLGPDGVTVHVPGSPVTARYDALALVVDLADGGIELVTRDAHRVVLEPTLHALTPAQRAEVVRRADPAVVVRRPARRPEEVPQPEARRRTFGRRRS